jgi:hypothetical protein
MSDIKFYLNVCETQPHVEIAGQRYLAGHRGEVPIGHTIKNDTLYIDMNWCGHKPFVGGASHITGISIRICPDAVTTIAVYDDPRMTVLGCCKCCSNGCCVYGSSGCGCG